MKPAVKKTALAFAIVIVVIFGAVVARRFRNDTKPEVLEYSAAMQSELPILIEFGGGVCEPCKAMKPIIEELHAEYADELAVAYVDTKKDPDTARAHEIQTIPVQVFLDGNGIELFRHVGVFSKEDIVAKWEELGVELGASK
jgi:thioredoxin 1